MDERFLLVVFDGLRPDLLRPDTTPNLLRFAARGTRFARARSVFPSETRVCSATVTTGCMPRRHGLVANRLAHPRDATGRGPAGRSPVGRNVDTGQMAALLELEQEIGEPLLDMPGLGARLAAAGRDFAVLSSGTTGQSHVLNPTAAALGQLTLSTHGAQVQHACTRYLTELGYEIRPISPNPKYESELLCLPRKKSTSAETTVPSRAA